MVQRLVVIRHGDFDEGQTFLNEEGRRQIERIAERVLSLCSNADSIALFSSVGPRAIESTQLLSTALAQGFTSNEMFGSHGRDNQDRHYADALAVLNNLPPSKTTAIIVTKGEYANGFIDFYGQKALKTSFGEQKLERGEAVLIKFN